VILRGEGKSFSSGGDLAELELNTTEFMALARAGTRMLEALGELGAITICCGHGYMMGAGAILPLSCDFRIGSPSITLSINEVALGYNVTWRSLPGLTQLVGPARAKEMVLLGRRYTAGQLLDYGYLHEVVPEESLVETAEAYASQIVRLAPAAAAVTKASINAYTRALDRAVHHMDFITSGFMSRSDNTRIAREAYLSGSTPEYTQE
jgi:enoyl-CoA hydratase/carnithine racemase